MPVHDIRHMIPQFNANHFPQYKFEPFPKMMINKETGKPFLDARKQPVIVQDEHEEKLFLAKHYKPEVAEEPKAVEIAVAAEEHVRRGPGRPPKLPADLK